MVTSKSYIHSLPKMACPTFIGIILHQISSWKSMNLIGNKHLSLTAMELVLTHDILYDWGLRTNFRPKRATIFEDILLI
jgi:hypothetical protein